LAALFDLRLGRLLLDWSLAGRSAPGSDFPNFGVDTSVAGFYISVIGTPPLFGVFGVFGFL
jgi:hypothetical protein